MINFEQSRQQRLEYNNNQIQKQNQIVIDDNNDSNIAQFQMSQLQNQSRYESSGTLMMQSSTVDLTGRKSYPLQQRVVVRDDDDCDDIPQIQEKPQRKRDVKAARRSNLRSNADISIKDDPAIVRQIKLEKDKQELLQRLQGKKTGGFAKNGPSGQLANRFMKTIDAEKEFDEDSKMQTISLIEKMHAVCLSDYDAIKRGDAAMNRFKMIDELSNLLNKKHVQQVFLANHGCRFLEMWLERNPDGSYPPVQVVECVLEVLDRLPIDQDHLESCNIAHMVTQYAASESSTNDDGEIPKNIISAATKLLQKWQTVVYQLSYEYDKDGEHEIKQRDLRRRLEVLRDLEKQAVQESLGYDKQKAQASREDDLIRKTPNGFIFMKQNFDWLEKPESAVDQGEIRGNSFKQSIAKVIQKHKALSTRNSRK